MSVGAPTLLIISPQPLGGGTSDTAYVSSRCREAAAMGCFSAILDETA